MPEFGTHQQQFGFHVGALHAEGFNTQLAELAIAAFLWPFVAVHLAEVPQLLRLVVQEAALLRCTHATGGAFGPQGKAVAVAVFKGVHLFFDDVGYFTD